LLRGDVLALRLQLSAGNGDYAGEAGLSHGKERLSAWRHGPSPPQPSTRRPRRRGGLCPGRPLKWRRLVRLSPSQGLKPRRAMAARVDAPVGRSDVVQGTLGVARCKLC
jgi:hypothetical protein